VAGEGYGKTLAVNSFLQKDPRKVVWVQLSERDNLGWRFWENYTGEIARVNPEAAKIYADIGFPESNRQFDRYLGLIKDGIISRERYVVVFDDFHLLNSSPVILFLERALSAPVSKNTIVMISQRELAMNTVGFLAKGLLSQITAEDLRFGKEEVAEYFRLHRIFLEQEELDLLCRDTEGWALALGLVLQGIKAGYAGPAPGGDPAGNGGIGGLPGGGSGGAGKGRGWDRVMLPVRKMEENIFSAMGAELQKFLIKLSLIEHWPRNLLESFESGGKNISAMEKFTSVIRFDAYLHGYRIQHLFLEFLKEKQIELAEDEIKEVCGKDAQWCIENNLPTDAAVDYERAGDYRGFVRLIESLPRMLPRAMASFFLETAERMIAANREGLLFREGEDWDFLFLRFIVRPRLLALLDRFKESSREFRAGIACFMDRPPGPRRSQLLAAAHSRLGILVAFVSRYTKDYNFAHWFEEGYHYYLENPEPVPAQGQANQLNIGSYAIQTGFPAGPGEIGAFIDACTAATPFASVSLGGYSCGMDTLARSELAYYQGDLNKAEQFARQAAFRGRGKNQYEVENRALFYLMRICVHKGDTAGIRELDRQMKALLEKGEYLNRYVIYDIITGRFYARLGLVEKVAPWLRKEREEGELNVLFRGFDTLVKVRCLFFEKDYPAALRALEQEQAGGELASFLLGFLETAVLEAAIRHQLGDQAGAFAALRKAYDAAVTDALDMPFIELGEYMYSLANAALKSPKGEKDPQNPAAGIPRLWLQNIRSAASAYAKERLLVAAQYRDAGDASSPELSEPELEVLNGLSRGRTSEEIAEDMKISLNMFGSFLRSVFNKLGAVNRADAIRIATAKGLL
jgi:LuxR family maltose regulon positive regulatory protein